MGRRAGPSQSRATAADPGAGGRGDKMTDGLGSRPLNQLRRHIHLATATVAQVANVASGGCFQGSSK